MSNEKKTVFISHSSVDERAAALVLQALEGSGIGCWISNRDIEPIENWASAITRGLQETKLVVLILSENSVRSKEVLKELTLASEMKMAVVVFRIDSVNPPPDFKYHITIEQWVPGANPPTERQLQKLVGAVDQSLLGMKRSWWQLDTRQPWSRMSWGRLLAMLALGAGIIAVIGVIMLSPYLRDLLGGLPPDGPPRQTEQQDRHAAVPDTALAPGVPEQLDLPIPDQPQVLAGEDEPRPVDPVRAMGTVTLTTRPPGASVHIDGTLVGNTPIRDHELPAGSYTARLRLAGHRPETRSVAVRAGGNTDVDITLSQEVTTLEVHSVPTAAQVVLDGSRLGTTPCTFDRLASGHHVVVVSKDGFATRTDTLRLRADQPYLHEVRLERLVGQLTVTVIPSGSIAINGDPKAADSNAPYTTSLRPGTYEIEARHVIHGVWRKTVDLAHGEDKNLVFDFSKEHDLVVTSDPPNAAIYVNDRFWNRYTPARITLRPGLRRIDVRREGYHSPGTRELMVEEGSPAVIHFDLIRAR